MKTIRIVALVTIAFCNPVAWGQEETDYWPKIRELLRKVHHKATQNLQSI